jgi:membrane fusion protein, macrolide-specific efflux system
MKSGKMLKILSLAMVALLTAMTSGCQYLLPKEEALQPPPLIEPKDVTYTTVEVKKGNITNSVQGVGRFESVKRVDVYYTAGGGRIKTIKAKIGDMVKAGDVLIELDVGDLNYNIKIAELQYTQLKNSYASVKKAMARAKDKTQLKNMEIDLKIADLRLKQLKEQQANAILRAPIDGAVTYVTNITQGSWVDAYSTLVNIEDQSEKMLTYIDDMNRSKFQIGTKVAVTFNSDGGKTQGEVVSTPFDREKYNKETLDKMLFIKIPDDMLTKAKVGEEAKLLLVLDERKDVLVLPRNVVLNYLQRRYVRVLENGIKVEKDVEVGLETPTEVEIVKGLTEGEKVIIR